MKTTYKEMREKLIYREEFNGNSVSAYRDNTGFYIVKSYSTVIYKSNGYFDNSYYSATTSKIQNILIEVFGLNDGIKKRD